MGEVKWSAHEHPHSRSGGREHALAWKLAGSPFIERLYFEFTRLITSK
jgi:Phosphoribosylamine-glycine ligase